MNLLKSTVASAALAFTGAAANAATVDFSEIAPAGPLFTITESDNIVTFGGSKSVNITTAIPSITGQGGASDAFWLGFTGTGSALNFSFEDAVDSVSFDLTRSYTRVGSSIGFNGNVNVQYAAFDAEDNLITFGSSPLTAASSNTWQNFSFGTTGDEIFRVTIAAVTSGVSVNFGLDNMSYTTVVKEEPPVAPVPLPATALLLGSAVAGLALMRRRSPSLDA